MAETVSGVFWEFKS